MRIDAVRGTADAIEPEQHSLGTADLGNRAVEPARTVLASKLPDDIVGPRHAATRHVRIEQERTPAQLREQVRAPAQGASETAHAKKAPRTYDVVDDLDAKARLRRSQDIHAGIIAVLRFPCKPMLTAGPPAAP